MCTVVIGAWFGVSQNFGNIQLDPFFTLDFNASQRSILADWLGSWLEWLTRLVRNDHPNLPWTSWTKNTLYFLCQRDCLTYRLYVPYVLLTVLVSGRRSWTCQGRASGCGQVRWMWPMFWFMHQRRHGERVTYIGQCLPWMHIIMG